MRPGALQEAAGPATYTSVMAIDGAGWKGKAELIYDQLRDDIESGKFEPGRPLPEIELVEYTGASRTPVREAIRRLAADGLVDLQPRRAPTVSLISLRSARELSNFRVLLEAEAIRLVAERTENDAALREEFESLERRFAELEVIEDLTPDGPFRAAAEDFDLLLARSTPNEYLRRAVTDLRPHTTRLRAYAHNDRTRLHQSVGEHRQMCRTIILSDQEAARIAITMHLRNVEQAVFQQLFAGSGNILVG